MDDHEELLVGEDPLRTARDWLEEASSAEAIDHNAVALATVGSSGLPNVRMVLIKEISLGATGGLAFYTNLNSVKAREIGDNPQAAMVAHWTRQQRQMRVRGFLEPVGEREADAYFASRHPSSRYGAWASRQSEHLDTRQTLMEAVEHFRSCYPEDPPRPPHWSGFRLRPVEVEFWCNGAYRLHDRFRWTRADMLSQEWARQRLYP